MRPTHPLRALPSSLPTPSTTLKQPLPALLPPIPLYRRVLRAHRKHLPPEMRVLGDEYVKAEFRAHRAVENPVHIVGFLSEWQMYAQQVEGENWRGGRLEEGVVGKMSDQQIGQLYELMQAIRRRDLEEDDNDPLAAPPPPPSSSTSGRE